MGALESVLNTVLSGVAGLNEDFNRRQQHNDGEAAVTKNITTQAEKAAQEGDWEWMHANQEALQRRIHPDHLQAILSTTTLNNARRFDAETAEGGLPTIPLSPKNINMRSRMPSPYPYVGNPIPGAPTAASASTPEQVVLQANSGPVPSTNEGGAGPSFSGLQGIPNNEASLRGQQYGALYTQPGQPQPPTAPAPMPQGADTPEDPALEGSLSLRDSIEQMKRVNAGLESVRNEYPAPTAQTPTVPTPTVAPTTEQPPEITLPSPHRPSSTTRDYGSTKITTTNPVMTGKEAMASMAAQATAQNAHPDKLLHDFHNQNARLKHPYDFDEVGFHEYRTQYWERSRKQIQDLLIANGATQDDAMRQSATMTYNKTGYVPSQWTGMVTPSAESVSNNAYHTVLKQANTQLSSVLQGLAAPLQSVKPSAILNDTFAQPFLLKAVDSIPGMELNPAARTSVLHSLASTAHSAFLSAVQQHTHGLNSAQQNYFAMSMASKAVGGNVPEQWRAFVENDLEKLGLVSREDMQYFQHMPPNQRPDIFAPDFGQRIGNFRAAVENSADYRKAMQQMAKSPETLAAVQQMFAGQKTGKDAITPATIGKQERDLAAQQHGVLKQQDADITRTNAIIPHEMLKDLQIADGIYQAGREAQKFAQAKDKNGQTIIDKYGDTPGSWREFSQSIQAGFGRSDKHLVAYLNRLAKVYNFERHELTGAATSVFEGSSLKHYIPNPDDNVRTGLRKLNTLIESLGGQLDKKLDQAQADYPRSAHEKFYRNQERAKQKQDTELDDIFTEAKKRRKP